MFAPSESASSGLSCTSRKSASMPTPTAARTRYSTYSRLPEDDVPLPPGSCTLCVPSKTTG